MIHDKKIIKPKEIPSNHVIDARHCSLVQRHKEKAKKDLYVMLFIGLVLLLPIFLKVFPHAIYSTITFNSSIDFVMLPVISLFLLWLIFNFVIQFPFRMKKVENFNPFDEDCKCCYGVVEEVWSEYRNRKSTKYYASVSVYDTDLFIKSMSMDMGDYYRLRSGSRCILVSYDNRSTYLIPIF